MDSLPISLNDILTKARVTIPPQPVEKVERTSLEKALILEKEELENVLRTASSFSEWVFRERDIQVEVRSLASRQHRASWAAVFGHQDCKYASGRRYAGAGLCDTKESSLLFWFPGDKHLFFCQEIPFQNDQASGKAILSLQIPEQKHGSSTIELDCLVLISSKQQRLTENVIRELMVLIEYERNPGPYCWEEKKRPFLESLHEMQMGQFASKLIRLARIQDVCSISRICEILRLTSEETDEFIGAWMSDSKLAEGGFLPRVMVCGFNAVVEGSEAIGWMPKGSDIKIQSRFAEVRDFLSSLMCDVDQRKILALTDCIQTACKPLERDKEKWQRLFEQTVCEGLIQSSEAFAVRLAEQMRKKE